MKRYEEGHVPAYEGISAGDMPTISAAIADAASNARVEADGAWFEVTRIQAEVLPHNQWVRAYRVIITPTD